MALASRFLKGLIRRSTTRLLGKVGGRLVSRMADTSADAPAASFTPKRDVYESMTRPAPAPATSEDDGQEHDHSHSHSHDHDHGH